MKKVFKRPGPNFYEKIVKHLPCCMSIKALYKKVGDNPKECYLYFCSYYQLTEQTYEEAKKVSLKGYYCSRMRAEITQLISVMSAERVLKQWEEAEAFKKSHGIEEVFWKDFYADKEKSAVKHSVP